jgi:hypothetical protein
VGTGRLPTPILVEISYTGPQSDQVTSSYICKVIEKKGLNRQVFGEHHPGRKLGEDSGIGGIILFRDIDVPSHSCDCQLEIHITHTDFVAVDPIDDWNTTTHWFSVDKNFRGTTYTLSEVIYMCQQLYYVLTLGI